VGGSSIIVGASIPGDILSGIQTGTVNPGTFYMTALNISTTPVNWSQGPLWRSGTFTVSLGVEPCRGTERVRVRPQRGELRWFNDIPGAYTQRLPVLGEPVRRGMFLMPIYSRPSLKTYSDAILLYAPT
jgi:hypothetical protein